MYIACKAGGLLTSERRAKRGQEGGEAEARASPFSNFVHWRPNHSFLNLATPIRGPALQAKVYTK